MEAILREPKKDADEDDPESEGKTITGWVSSKALVNLTTPNGDKIIFGEAADSEDQASRRRGRRDAAQDAMRLYYRVYDLFPTSPLAAEGLYRAADIRWQIDRSDVLTRPSARERDAYMRGQIDEQWMKLVIKKFPGTKWADLAAFHLLENKLCGDWQGASKCPEKEADMYEKYAKRARAVALRARSAVPRRLAPLGPDRNLQDRSQPEKIRRIEDPRAGDRPKNHQPIRPERLASRAPRR